MTSSLMARASFLQPTPRESVTFALAASNRRRTITISPRQMRCRPQQNFPTTLPPGFVSPGGFGIGGFSIVTTSGNPKGSTVITFTLLDTRVVPGMTFISSPNQPQHATGYTIIGCNYVTNQVTIAPPGTRVNLGTVRCFFLGVNGSTQGGGLAPNGQRAG